MGNNYLKDMIQEMLRDKNLLTENLKDSSRKVLYVDEHGKHIVWESDYYAIVVDNPNSATYVTAWEKIDEKSWKRVGSLNSSEYYRGGNDYLKIREIGVDSKHQRTGLGTKMYKALIDFSGDNISGLLSYLPDRSNRNAVPKIYRRFGAVIEDEDYQIIKF